MSAAWIAIVVVAAFLCLFVVGWLRASKRAQQVTRDYFTEHSGPDGGAK